MRAMLLMCVTVAALCASFGADASGGAYASLPARDAAACARLCADDSLCIAWSFQATNTCDLRATAPAAPEGIANGLSRRAPGELRQSHPAEALAAAPIAGPAMPIAEGAGVAEQAGPTSQDEDEVDRMLLGGFVEDGTGLRH